MTAQLNSFQIIHPKNPEQLHQRNVFLQATLREHPQDFSIAAEYPLVLSPETADRSYCVMDQGSIIAHLNFWPRTLVDSTNGNKFSIGLIGNVATAPAWRGRGLMRELLAYIEQHAASIGVCLMVLWSDLTSFYQKLGYEALGEEHRCFFSRASLNPFPTEDLKINLHPVGSITNELAITFLRLRSPIETTLQITPEEYHQLLLIPQSYVFDISKENRQCGFFVAGKGADLGGVIHEWGADHIDHILGAIALLLRQTTWEEAILLTPPSINPNNLAKIHNYSSKIEKHSMALGKTLHNVGEKAWKTLADRGFLWGFDSI